MMLGRAALLARFVALGGAQLGPIPKLGKACHGCKCGDVDLSGYRGHEFRTPTDDDGYVTMFQMCDEIPAARLPEGCKPIPGEPGTTLPHPAVVRFNGTDPTDCDMLGSFGPCKSFDCGMTYQELRKNGTGGSVFAVTWRYQQGCEYTFQLELEEGHEDMPTHAPDNDPYDGYECFWTMQWPSLNAFPARPAPAPGDTSPGKSSAAPWVVACLLLCGFAIAAAVVYKKRSDHHQPSSALLTESVVEEKPYSSLGAE